MNTHNIYGINIVVFTIMGLILSYSDSEADITKDQNSKMNGWWGLGGAILGAAAAHTELKIANWYFPNFDWIDAETKRLKKIDQSVRKQITAIDKVIFPS